VKKPSVQTRIRQIFAQLQALFPTPLPTLLTLSTKLVEHIGDCQEVTRGGKQYLLLRLEKGLSLNHSLELLFHEYAHALNWRPEGFEEDEDHGPHWGLYMSDVCSWWDEAPR
jgi:hypothetical protein